MFMFISGRFRRKLKRLVSQYSERLIGVEVWLVIKKRKNINCPLLSPTIYETLDSSQIDLYRNFRITHEFSVS